MGAGPERASYLTPVCFFLISVSYKLAWTAISSLLSEFSAHYGPHVLLELNIAYFLPSIPVLVLQTVFNDSMDRRLGGLARGSLARFTLGVGGLVLLTATFTSLTNSHTRLLATTCLVGMCYGTAFGTSYQLASRFPPINTVMLTTGFVSSGPIVLVLDLLLKRKALYSDAGLHQLFTAVAFITSFGLLASWVVVVANHRTLGQAHLVPQRVELKLGRQQASSGWAKSSRTGKASVRQGKQGAVENGHQHTAVLMDAMEGGGLGESGTQTYGSSGNGSDQQGSLGGQGGRREQGGSSGGGWGGQGRGLPGLHSSGGSAGGGHDSSQQHSPDSWEGGSGMGGGQGRGGFDSSSGKLRKPDIPLMVLAGRISPAAASIFLSVGSSMLVFPFFTYMHSTGLMGTRLPQVLFYVRLVGDILGRLVPRRLQAVTVPRLMFWAAAKTLMVPLLFGCIFTPQSTGGDLGAVVLVGAFWMLSGYVNTCAYLVAPTLVPSSAKPRASGLMTVAFQSSCFVALLLAAAVHNSTKQYLEVAQLVPPAAPSASLL